MNRASSATEVAPNPDAVFRKVLTVGPTPWGQGGMGTVLIIYRRHLPFFRQLSTSSTAGFIPGLFAFAATMARMPWERLRGRNILHVHAASGKSFIRKKCVVSWGKMLGFKIIFHCHSGHIKDYFSHRGLKFAKKTLDKCSAIVCLSKSWQRYFEDTLGYSNVRIIYNPQEPVAKVVRPEASTPLRLLYLGNLVDAKGIFDFMDAMAANSASWAGRVHLTVCGAGEVKRFKDFVSHNGLDDMVDFRGWVGDQEKESLFASHHVLLLPSHAECLPMSILEAMAHGLAVVASRVGGIPDMVTDGAEGILINAGDRQALAAAVNAYLADPALAARHGQCGLRRVRGFYPEKIKSDLCSLYNSLV